MAPPEDSENSVALELASLQLDVKTLQRYRDVDKKEFAEFAQLVQANFVELQNNFTCIQANFAKFFTTTANVILDTHEDEDEELQAATPGQGSNTLQDKQQAPTGKGKLFDENGRELNMDGTLKVPYRHPNAAGQPCAKDTKHDQQIQAQTQIMKHAQETEEGGFDGRRNRARPLFQQEVRRNTMAVKPAKYNIPEFEGEDADAWIQQIEQYFESSRTPTDQRTEIAVSYLKGKAMNWWRGTGHSASTLPWFRFCGSLADRFAESSICDNVKAFHALTQISTVSVYIEQFERLLNIMRRDNPNLPNDYYVNCFISGLNDYIQNHLQCHKPKNLQEAMWFARRIEMSQQAKRPVYQPSQPTVRKQMYVEQAKPTTNQSGLANIIQQARLKNVCYKRKEPWFPGHKQVCKFGTKAQIQALQKEAEEETEIVYVTEYDEDSEEEPNMPKPDTTLKLSMHAVNGKQKKQHTFTLTATVGNTTAMVLVDSGSTGTFMTPELAKRANVAITPNKKVRVMVANGENLYSEFQSQNCAYTLQGNKLLYNFRILPLSGYDIIFGTDWLHFHSPVEIDYKKMFIKLTDELGKKIVLMDESLPTSADIQQSESLNLLKEQPICGAFLFVNQVHPPDSSLQQKDIIPSFLTGLLQKYKDIFATPNCLPPARTCDHSISLVPDAKIVNQRSYRLPHHQKDAMEKIIAQLIAQQVIRNSVSPFSSPALLVKKKDYTWRLVNDFRKLNAQTIKNKYPIPVIEDLLDELHGAKIFSKIDLRSGYHQIRMKEEDIPKTAFNTHMGHFEYLVMPFGLTNAPATFQSLMNTLLAPFLRKFSLVFFDDILIYSKTEADHIHHLSQIFQVLRENKLSAKMEKCTFGQKSVEYLGHILQGDGVATDPSKIMAISQWPSPTNITELRSFLGLTGYYRRFIQNYGIICRPLFDSLKKNAFLWTDAQEMAFAHLKKCMTEAPVLAMPDFKQPFVLEADASGYGIGAVLMQNQKPISFFSKAIGPKAAALSTYDKEALAIIEALKKWKHYFAASSLVIKTDQQSLKYIQEQKLTDGIQHKLLIKLLGYNYSVEYKRGKENKVADALSRVKYKVLALFGSVVQPTWITNIIATYATDDKCKELLAQLAVNPESQPNYSLKNGVLRFKGKIVVGNDMLMKKTIIGTFHTSELGGHSGERATFQRVHLVFFWPKMRQQIT